MKKTFQNIFRMMLVALPLSACMDNTDAPDTDDYIVTSPTSIGETNYSIARLKEEKSALFTQTNAFEKIEEDLIIEGVVAANDAGGNLYQTILLRDIDEEAGTDQAIVLGIKNTWLSPYFPLGQRVKVNLKNLYVGCYSKLPKIGQPYYTSSGNLRLGAMLFELCATNVELVGTPDPACPECQPKSLNVQWLRASANKNYMNYPMLVTISGTLKEADGEAIFAPEELQDAGYGVDRTLSVKEGNLSTSVTVRTSTQNAVAFTVMPTDERAYTGLLSYYDSWQIQLRGIDDISPAAQ